MTIRQFYTSIIAQLQATYPTPEAVEMGYRLIEHFLSLSKIDLALSPNTIIEDGQQKSIQQAVGRLLKNEPIQYIIGQEDFYELSFDVDSNVLIPRPETEELVKLIIDNHQHQKPKILDVGTGSGCIPISLAKHIAKADVYACDISEGALSIANFNAKKNDVPVHFFHCDILDKIRWPQETYDIIVSNPPYVLNSEKALMRDNVLDFEPHLALFVDDDDPLLFYTSIAEFGIKALNSCGALYFEINEAYGEQTVRMLESAGYSDVRLHQDIFGKERMVSAYR